MLKHCPHCLNLTVEETGECTVCGMNATESAAVDERYLVGMLANVRVMLQNLGFDSFQQMSGTFSPRPFRGDEDGILFTEDDCRMSHRHLLRNNIPCVRIKYTAKGKSQWSLIFAHTPQQAERGVKKAQDHAKRHHGHRIQIYHTADDA